jgi:hypothetical protein
MNIYYIAINEAQEVIAYGNSGDGVSFPQPNGGVQTYATIDELNAALEPYGFTYSGE